jgi:hypothetical protein
MTVFCAATVINLDSVPHLIYLWAAALLATKLWERLT